MVYELKGTETVKEIRSKAPCGTIVATEYYEGEKLVRRDIRVEVDPDALAMQGSVNI